MTMLFETLKYFPAYSQGIMSQEVTEGDTAVPTDPPVFKTPSDEQTPDTTEEPSSSPSLSLAAPEQELTNESADVCAPVGPDSEPLQDQSEDHSSDQVTECSETVSLEEGEGGGGEVEVEVEVGYTIVCDHHNVCKTM